MLSSLFSFIVSLKKYILEIWIRSTLNQAGCQIVDEITGWCWDWTTVSYKFVKKILHFSIIGKQLLHSPCITDLCNNYLNYVLLFKSILNWWICGLKACLSWLRISTDFQ